MALPQGINFRATVPYVTDGGTEFCQIAPGTGGNYPTTTPQGNVVGWEGTAFGQVDSRDRSTTVDHRLAGSNFTTTAATATYRIDLPAAGSYNIRLAAGDASFTSNVQIELFDDTTSLGVLASATSLSGGQFKDATNATLTSANWPGSNTAVTKTFSSTICRIKVGNTAGSSRYINHFYIEAASGGGSTTGTITATEGADTLSASGGVLVSGSMAVSEGADTISAAGGVSVSGTLSANEGADTLAASGSVSLAAITGSIAASEAPDTMSAQDNRSAAAPDYSTGKRPRRYVVRIGDRLLAFTDPEAAKAALEASQPAEPEPKAAPAPKIAPAKVERALPPPQVKVDLSEIRAAAKRANAEAEYKALLAKQQYDTLLALLERIRAEEEEDDWLLMAAA